MGKWSKYLVYSNLWVGIAVGAFSYFTMSSFYSLNIGFILMVVFSTAFTYNYMRFVQIRGYDLRNNFTFKAWVAGHRSEVLLFMLVFGALSGLAILEIFSIELVLLMILPGIVSAAYPLSFKNPFSSFTSLRTAPGLKMFLISATWSYVTVIVPTVLYDLLTLETVLEFVMRTLLILALVIPFDIRDVPYDDENMKTIPQVIGRDQARQLSMLFILIYQLWLLVRLFLFGDPIFYTVSLLAGLEIGYWLVRYSHREHSELYFSFWIEGVPIFCGLLLMIGSLLF